METKRYYMNSAGDELVKVIREEGDGGPTFIRLTAVRSVIAVGGAIQLPDEELSPGVIIKVYKFGRNIGVGNAVRGG